MSVAGAQTASLASMEPLFVPEHSPHRAALNDLALELAQRSAGFRSGLSASFVPGLTAGTPNSFVDRVLRGPTVPLL